MKHLNIEKLIAAPESRVLEFKREVPRRIQSLLQTVISFSNGSGGDIIIGISDDGKVLGIDEDPQDLEERLASAVYDSISPIPTVFFQTVSSANNHFRRI